MNRSISENLSERPEVVANNLQQRVVDMHRQISALKDRLKDEQNLLAEEKGWLSDYNAYMLPNTKDADRQTIGDSQRPDFPFQGTIPSKFRQRKCDNIDSITDRQPSASSPSITVHKQHLEDIQRKCDQELGRLENYILNIQELKNNWMNIKVMKEGKKLGRDMEEGFF